MYYLRGGKKKLISTKPLAFSKMIWIFHDVFRMSEWKPYFREHIFINHVGPWTIILICVKQSTTRFDPFLWMRMTNIETKNPRRPNSNLHFLSPRKCYIMCHPFPIFFCFIRWQFQHCDWGFWLIQWSLQEKIMDICGHT